MDMKRSKGTTDFYPENILIRNYIFDILRQVANSYNFKEIESPALESLELLTKKEGEEIRQQIFTLEKRGDERYGLRFDLTIPATRMFIQIQKSIPKPVKWFYLSNMWRYEQPQHGRQREFYQFSAELFGVEKVYADAEIISLAIDSLLSLGLKRGDFFVRLNSRNLLEGLLTGFINKDRLYEIFKIIDKKTKIPEKEFKKEFVKFGLSEHTINSVLEILNIDSVDKIIAKNEMAERGIAEINSVLNLLYDRKEFIKIDLTTVRGLAYYTGIVFEIFDSENKYRSIAGGGRYDNLVELLGGQTTPATGFAIGYSTLTILLKNKGLLPQQKLETDYFIAMTKLELREVGDRIANSLRKKYSVEIDITGKSLNSQLRYANSINAKKVVIVGEKELKDGMALVREMDTGKERRIKIEEI